MIKRKLDLSEDVQRAGAITAIQVSQSATSIAAGLDDHSGELYVEGVHSGGDALAWMSRVALLAFNATDKPWVRPFRRMTYAMVCLSAAVSGAKSGIDFSSVLHQFDGWNKPGEELHRITQGFVVAVGNEAGYQVSQRFKSASHMIEDAKKHQAVDRRSSHAIAASYMVGAVVPFVAEAAGAAMGAYVAWHMRPTNTNIDHHDHEH